jgi:multiple sugar transport system substrate-binding protein
MLAVSATACSKGESASSGSTPKTDTKPKEPFELVVYYGGTLDWNAETWNKVFTQPLQKKYPYMSFKFLNGADGSIADLLAKGQTFDLVLGSIGVTPRDLLDTELKYDISGLIKQRKLDLTAFDSNIIDAGTKLAKGGLYGLPLYLPPSTIYYSKDLFDKFGVAYPKDGSTWDDMYEMSKRLTRPDGQTNYYGFTLSFAHQVIMNQWSIPMTTADGKSTFDTDARWKEFTENLLRFYKLPGYDQIKRADLGLAPQRNMFSVSKTAAMHASLTSLLNADQLNGINWELTTFPTLKGSKNGPQAYPNYLYITTSNKHKEDTLDALAYWTSEEFQLENSRTATFMTPLKSAKVKEAFSQDSTLYKGKNIKALWPQTYAPPIQIDQFTSAYNDYEPGMLDVITAGKDVNTMLREIAEKANKRIDDIKAKQK